MYQEVGKKKKKTTHHSTRTRMAVGDVGLISGPGTGIPHGPEGPSLHAATRVDAPQ